MRKEVKQYPTADQIMEYIHKVEDLKNTINRVDAELIKLRTEYYAERNSKLDKYAEAIKQLKSE